MSRIPLISGGKASGNCTTTPTMVASRPRCRSSACARGTPSRVIRVSEIVAPSTETPSADHRPAAPKPRSEVPATRNANAATGSAR
jgi:hypothetical protein